MVIKKSQICCVWDIRISEVAFGCLSIVLPNKYDERTDFKQEKSNNGKFIRQKNYDDCLWEHVNVDLCTSFKQLIFLYFPFKEMIKKFKYLYLIQKRLKRCPFPFDLCKWAIPEAETAFPNFSLLIENVQLN